MSDKIDYVCTHCGNDEISVEAFVKWDIVLQDFIVLDVCDKGHYCAKCEGLCIIESIPLKPPQMPVARQPRLTG